MILADKDGNAVSPPYVVNGIQYPPNIGDIFSAEELAAIGFQLVDPPPPPVVLPPLPTIITDVQFFQQLAIEKIVSEDEALAAVQNGTMPAAITKALSDLPTSAQFGAKMLMTGATSLDMSNPTVAAICADVGITSDKLQAFWVAASNLT